MSYSNINEVFNNNNIKKDNTIKWDDFSDDEYTTHKKYSLMDIGTLMDADDMNTVYPNHTTNNATNHTTNHAANHAANHIANTNGTSLNSLNPIKIKDGKDEGKISHRDCVKKYFNISSQHLDLNVALKHINSCPICQNEIERVNNYAKFNQQQNQQQHQQQNQQHQQQNQQQYQQQQYHQQQDCKSCNYVSNNHNIINKIDDITNKVNTLSNGYGYTQGPIHGYNYGQGIDYMNYKINEAVKINVNEAVRNSVNEAVRNSVNEAVKVNINDISEMISKRIEHFGNDGSTKNNGNNTFLTISIVLIIILLLIDIYLRLKK